MAQLVALMSGVVLGGVAEVVGSNLARGKIFTASIGSVDSLYPSVYIYIYRERERELSYYFARMFVLFVQRCFRVSPSWCRMLDMICDCEHINYRVVYVGQAILRLGSIQCHHCQINLNINLLEHHFSLV